MTPKLKKIFSAEEIERTVSLREQLQEQLRQLALATSPKDSKLELEKERDVKGSKTKSVL